MSPSPLAASYSIVEILSLDAEQVPGDSIEERSYYVRVGDSVRTVKPWSPESARALTDLNLDRVPDCIAHTLRGLVRCDDWVELELEALRASLAHPLYLTIVSNAPEIHLLPWELLRLRRGGLLGDRVGVIIRHSWPGNRVHTPGVRAAGTGRVLMAWSDAGGDVPVEAHARAILAGSRAGGICFNLHDDQLPRVSGARLSDRLAAAGDRPYEILHVLCHGRVTERSSGLVLDADSGEDIVGGERLSAILAPFLASLRLIVLCACHGAGYLARQPETGSVAQCLHRAGAEYVLSFRQRLTRQESVDLASRLYTVLDRGTTGVEGGVARIHREMRLNAGTNAPCGLQLLTSPERILLSQCSASNDGDPPRAYKRELVAHLDRLIAELALVTVFAPQQEREIESVVVDLDAERLPSLANDAPRPLGAWLSGDPHGRWILQGGPGSGKSLALAKLARDLAIRARERLRADEALEPSTFPVFERLSRPARGSPTEAIDWCREHGRAVFLLDGLDEVRERDLSGCRTRIRVLAGSSTCAIIVAARPVQQALPGCGFETLRLLPLDSQTGRLVAGRWLSDTQEIDLLHEQLHDCPELLDMARNPLALCIFARHLSSAGAPLWMAGARLAQALIHGLRRGGQGDRVAPIRLGRMEDLARTLLDSGEQEWSTEALEATLSRSRCGRSGGLDLAQRSGLVTLDGDTWRLLSPFLIEHLSAGSVRRVLGEDRASDCARSPFHVPPVQPRWPDVGPSATHWARTIAFAAASEARPIDAVHRLCSRQPVLARRAIAHLDQLPLALILQELEIQGKLDLDEPLPLVREALVRLRDRPTRIALFLRMARETRAPAALQLLGAGLLASGADDESIDLVRRRAGGAGGLGIPQPSWASIPPGSFWMGSPPEEPGRRDTEGPRHLVTITRGFRMLATPVTRALHLVVTGATPTSNHPDLRFPAEGVTWDAARSFCESLSSCIGFPVRLPREAEWEYACRAGSTTRFFSGDDIASLERVGWCKGNAGGVPHPVAQLPGNAWGLYDMHGGVAEWCADPWEPDFSRWSAGRTVDPAETPAPGDPARARVRRGGGFRQPAEDTRVAAREGLFPRQPWLNRGFRVLAPPVEGST